MAAAGDNCTDNIPRNIPNSVDFFRNFGVGFIILIVVCAVLTIISIGIYIEEIFCILKAEVKDRTERSRPIWIFGLYPVIATTSLISVCVPRSTVLNDLVAALYLSMCILQFLKIIISYFGGRDQMILALANEKLKLRSKPFCFCVCCPEVPVNKQNLRKMYYIVLQVIIIRPLLFFCTSVYLADLGTDSMPSQEAMIVVSVLHMCSTLIAMYGLVLVFNVSQVHLEIFHIKRKFAMLHLVLVFVNLQNGIFYLLATFGVFSCTTYGFTAKARASHLHHTVLIFEMFVLSMLARFCYRKKEPLSLLKTYTERQNVSPTTETSGTPQDAADAHVSQRSGEQTSDAHDAHPSKF